MWLQSVVSYLAVLGLVGLVEAAPSRDIRRHVLHERRDGSAAGTWAKSRRLPKDAMLPVRIGLKQSNLAYGHDRLMNISNPASEHYGQHLSADEVMDLFAPSTEVYERIQTWVTSSGISADRVSQSTNKQWLQFDASVHELENLLYTQYHLYTHGPSGAKDIACEEYHVPTNIQDDIDYITPGIRLRTRSEKLPEKTWRKLARRQKQPRRVRPMYTTPERVPGNGGRSNLANCSAYVTPECIRVQYEIPEGSKAAPGNELGIFESLNDHYSKTDLDAYFSNVYPKIPNGTYPIENPIDGAIGAATTPSQVGVESDLDFEAAFPLIWPQKAVLFQTDDQYYEINATDPWTPYLGFFNTFLDALDGSYCTSTAYGETGNCKDPACLDPIYPDPNPGGFDGSLQCGVFKPTNVISISYGGGEADLPAYYLRRQCDEIMKLGLQGVTVVVSSGDSGVGSSPGDGGYPNGCAGPAGRVFYPSALATCPYVLAVGSTQFEPRTNSSSAGHSGRLVESATTSFPSGGGFSNYFPVAPYQEDAVSGYFSRVNLSFTGYVGLERNLSSAGEGVFNVGGRGYPDVSAIGDRYVVRANGTWARIGGTSLAAPVWASMLTLVNEERIAAGKKTVGFVNPVLYSHPEVFNDVTKGSNPNCHSTGFLGAKGWDPVTGLG